jgi:transposase InsO family protein
MPWKEVSVMTQRRDFVVLASAANANIRELCRRFKISPTTGYKWLERYQNSGEAGLREQSRRPLTSPRKTAVEKEQLIVALRRKHPAWSGRKLRSRLLQLNYQDLPAPSTCQAILKRHDLIDPAEARKHKPFQRYEKARPNELWQMDFKGDFPVGQGRCYPLTILDDHSRFAVALQACARNTFLIVQAVLIKVFRLYGLPDWITCDNGPPWGSSCRGHYTQLTVWLIRLGIGVTHSRPHHPQTQGKDERFHRTLEAEVLRYQTATTLTGWQQHFDPWREIYNHERPHDSLGQQVPAARYQPSLRSYPEQLPPIEYGPNDLVRKVRHFGHIKFAGRDYRIGSAFYGLHVALRATTKDGLFEVFFCHQKLGMLSLDNNKLTTY